MLRAVVLLLVLSAVCGNMSSKAEPRLEQVSLARDIQPILDGHCVQCHMTGAAQAGLILEDGASYEMLVGVPSSQARLSRVQPGQPEASYLFLKLMGTHAGAGGEGSGMPLVEGVYKPLDAKSIALIRSWIQSGAKRD